MAVVLKLRLPFGDIFPEKEPSAPTQTLKPGYQIPAIS